jgi:benzoyl-CoA-dihydrodiol lyase
MAEASDRPAGAAGVDLTPLKKMVDEKGYHYEFVDAAFDRQNRVATITVRAPQSAIEESIETVTRADWWPLQICRELDDAILSLRSNQPELGLWILKTSGDSANVLRAEAHLLRHRDHWFAREVLGMMRRTFSRNRERPLCNFRR